jgi:hypothetical protein
MTTPKPAPKADQCDRCGVSDRCKGTRFCRRCYRRLFGREPGAERTTTMIDFDTQDKYPLPSVRAWFRERIAGWGWPEWCAFAWCVLAAAALVLTVGYAQGCESPVAQIKREAASAAGDRAMLFAVNGQAPSPSANGGSLVVLWWGGLGLCIVAFASFVLSFVPVVKHLFSWKMALSCGLVGAGCLFIYDFLVEWRWLISLLLAVGAALWIAANWKALRNPREFARQLWEFVTRRDSNKDGRIGPEW